MNYAGFDFSYFLSPKHLIKMVMNFAGFKSEDILDNINDKNFSNFTMVSWMELVVQLYYLQLWKAQWGIQEKPLSLFWRWSDEFLLKHVGGCGQEEGHWRLELWPGTVPGLKNNPYLPDIALWGHYTINLAWIASMCCICLLAPSGALIAIPTYYWSTTTPPPLFQTTLVLNTGLSLSEPL